MCTARQIPAVQEVVTYAPHFIVTTNNASVFNFFFQVSRAENNKEFKTQLAPLAQTST